MEEIKLGYGEIIKKITKKQLQDIIDRYPNTEIYDSALLSLNTLELNKARMTGDIEGYTQYLSFLWKYQLVENLNKISFIIDSLRFDSTLIDGADNGLNNFVVNFPNSKFIDKAREFDLYPKDSKKYYDKAIDYLKIELL